MRLLNSLLTIPLVSAVITQDRAGVNGQSSSSTTIGGDRSRGATMTFTEEAEKVLTAEMFSEMTLFSQGEPQQSSPFSLVGGAILPSSDPYGSDFGATQEIVDNDDGNYTNHILDRIEQTRHYMNEVVHQQPKYEKTRNICRNQHPLCTFWSLFYECNLNPTYMRINCAPTCQSCEDLDAETRCRRDVDEEEEDAFQPGDINKMFENIVNDPIYQQYQPIVVTSPYSNVDADSDSPATTSDDDGMWMILFQNLFTDKEASYMTEIGEWLGFQRSTNLGVERMDGTYTAFESNGRTSSDVWCNYECKEHPVTRRIMKRIANITGTPETNAENFQLTKYEDGQYYDVHHDMVPHHLDSSCGVRALSMHLFFNDLPQEHGGGTDFPSLDRMILPRRGSALLWPNVLNSQPNVRDDRAHYMGQPVTGEHAVKYGAQVWIHQRDYQSYHARGCV